MLKKPGGLHRALTWRYILVTTGALLVVELLAIILMTRFAPPYTFDMQPDVYLTRELADTARAYLLDEDMVGLATWLDSLQQPVLNVSFDDNWLRLNLSTFPVREQQTILVFREGDGVLAATPTTNSFASMTQIEDLPGPFSSNLLRSVPGQPGNNIVTTRSDSWVLSIFPIQQQDGTLLGLFIVLNLASERPPLLSDVLLLAGGSTLALVAVTAVLGGGFGYLVSRVVVRRLNNLVQTTARWGMGDFSHPVQDERASDELADMAYHLNHLRTQIQELMTMREQLAVLEERSRFARELHDSVKQQVFTLRMNLATIEVLLGHESDDVQRQLQRTISLAQNIQDELTLMIGMFREQMLSAVPIAHRLRTLITAWSQQTTIWTDFEHQLDLEPPLRTAHAVYRLVQEALANVQKHSGANQVRIRLNVSHTVLTLHVHDNGHGFDTTQPKKGFGLVSMRERAEALDGIITVTSSETGTQLQVTIPMEGNSHEPDFSSDR